MRQLIFLLTIVFLCNTSFAQTDECQSGIDSAKVDYSKGVLRTYIFGLTNSYTFGRILKDDYGIDAVYWGCIVEEKWDCYSEFMNSRIKEKYGNDIFEKVSRKTQQLDSLGKGDRDMTFPGGEKALMKFVYCNMDLAKAKYTSDKKGTVYLKFTVDKVGKVTDIKILKTPSKNYSKEAIRIMTIMPKWTSATQNGKFIKQVWNLPIKFDEDWKEKHCP